MYKDNHSKIDVKSNDIYKLIKKAKDSSCLSNDPIKKIISNPIEFVYSFTLNSNSKEENCYDFTNNLIKEESSKNKKENYEKNKKLITDIHNTNKNMEDNNNTIIFNNKFEKFKNSKLLYNTKKRALNRLKELAAKIKITKRDDAFRNKSWQSPNNNLYPLFFENHKDNKFILHLKHQNLNIEDKRERDNKNNNLLNSKRKEVKNENKKKNKIEKPKVSNKNNTEKKNISSTLVKNKLIHQLYNSKSINLWENEDEESNENDSKSHQEKGEKKKEVYLIHKQLEFLSKSEDTFKKYNVAKKSEYDRDLDKGRAKKIHKNKIAFKKHKNYFQKISNKQIKYQNKHK